MSEVFRYTLRRSQTEWVLLEDEMDFARAYLEVERARFGDRMQVEVRVDDDVSTVRVPTMTVQTLVENAVKHGVARLSGPARVEISACARDGRLLVDVILYGHLHVPINERRGDVLFLNGGQAYASFMVPATVAWLTIEDGVPRGEIEEIAPAG